MKQLDQTHLSDAQFAAFALGERAAAAEHIAACEHCRHEAESLAAGLLRFREQAHAAAARDDFFWARQRAQVRARVPWTERPLLRWASTAVAAIVLAGALLLVRVPAPQPEPLPNPDAADEALLLEVQNDVGRYAPAALQPAQALADERNTLIASQNNRRNE